MNNNEWQTVLPWLKLSLIEGLGPSRIAKLVEYFGSASSVFDADYSTLEKLVYPSIADSIKKIKHNSYVLKQLDITYNWLISSNFHHIVCPHSEMYPIYLKQINDYPPVLFMSGDISLVHTPQLAIVGTRKPTLLGKTLAEKISKKLALKGITVTSGMAKGIDTAAHHGALAETNYSIGVMGSGIDVIYPSENQLLAKKLATSGLLVSEFNLGTIPIPGNFPRRNRIISGMSLGVLVVEAAIKSGSLITARLALEYGREVFAMPGSLQNAKVKGCHYLIRNGAVLIEDVEDILQELKKSLQTFLPTEQSILNNKHNTTNECFSIKHQKIEIDEKCLELLDSQQRILAKKILELLEGEALHIDEILLQMDIKQDILTYILTILEVNHFIELTSNGYRRV